MKKLIELQETTGSLWKSQVLRGFTELEKKVFLYALDPYKIYNIKQVGDIDGANLGEPTEELFIRLNILLYKSISLTNKQLLIQEYAESHGDLIKLIISGKLNCGVGATLFNKVFPKYIPQFKIQKATSVPLDKLTFPMLAQLKYNGNRMVIIRNESGEVYFKTSNGNLVNLPQTKAKLEAVSSSSYVLDTEVTFAAGKSEVDRTTISGLMNSAMHGGIIDESILVFTAFDALTIEEFNTQTCRRNYQSRWKQMMFILEAMYDDQFIFAVSIPMGSIEDIEEYYAQVINQGFEGLILKDLNHLYEFKRSKAWVKMKEVKDADLVVTGYYEGTGKYTGQIGSLICLGTVEDKPVSVGIGTGLSDSDRAKPFEHFDHKVIEVKYNSLIQDSVSGDWSLFLPRFSCIRHDK